MKHIRQIMGHQLIDMLHETNMADVTEENADGYELMHTNDLNPKCSRQHEAHGHIANALTSIGFNKAREVYEHEGDVDAAHAEIDAQYGEVAA